MWLLSNSTRPMLHLDGRSMAHRQTPLAQRFALR